MIATFTFLERIKQNKKKKATALAKFWSTCNLFRERKMCCLIPLATFYGLQQAFVFGDFTSVIFYVTYFYVTLIKTHQKYCGILISAH